MLSRRSKIYRLWLYCLVILLIGCAKIDTLPQIEIQVIDEYSSPVKGTYVALFASQDDWNLKQNPVQVWRRTDEFGKVVFVDLDEMKYFVYARNNSKDNTFGGVSVTQPLKLNQRSKIVLTIR